MGGAHRRHGANRGSSGCAERAATGGRCRGLRKADERAHSRRLLAGVGAAAALVAAIRSAGRSGRRDRDEVHAGHHRFGRLASPQAWHRCRSTGPGIVQRPDCRPGPETVRRRPYPQGAADTNGPVLASLFSGPSRAAPARVLLARHRCLAPPHSTQVHRGAGGCSPRSLPGDRQHDERIPGIARSPATADIHRRSDDRRLAPATRERAGVSDKPSADARSGRPPRARVELTRTPALPWRSRRQRRVGPAHPVLVQNRRIVVSLETAPFRATRNCATEALECSWQA
jgi:hypothetical protein